MKLIRSRLPPVSIAGLIDFVSDVPYMPHAACRQRGMAAQYDKAAAGDELAIEKCVKVTCRLCSARRVCASWAAGLTPAERQRLGVVGGVAYVTPSRPPGRPQPTKTAGVV
jgi:hypothetical protein